jgi:FMN phosphatase YigB (HAD superfamily)
LADVLGVPGQRCLLIDDSEVNVRMARQAGWSAIQFLSAPQLAEELAARGLIT